MSALPCCRAHLKLYRCVAVQLCHLVYLSCHVCTNFLLAQDIQPLILSTLEEFTCDNYIGPTLVELRINALEDICSLIQVHFLVIMRAVFVVVHCF